MKKLFLWTFVLTLLCTWAIVGADQSPKVPIISSQAPDLDRVPIKAEKDRGVQEMISGSALTTNAAPAGSAVPTLEKEEGFAEPQGIYGAEATQIIEEPYKPLYTGPKNVPDQNVILQGGDVCAQATVIPGIPYNADGSTAGFTDDYEESCFYSPSTSPDVVYSYTPEVDIAVNISLCQGQTDYDTKLYVYEDVCQVPDDGQEPYACNDDFCSSPYLWVSYLECVPMLVGHTYYIVVDGYGGASGNYNIDITECVPPTGACCVEEVCVFTSEEQPCLDAGGDWYEGESCPDYVCPPIQMETCADESVWDNGDADGVNGYRPTLNWDPLGIIDDFQFEADATFNCIRVEIIEGTTPMGVPSDIMSARVRIYNAPNGLYALDWPTDGPNPLYDITYQKADGSMMEIDSGVDYFSRDLVWFDLCGEAMSLGPGNYGIFVIFPGRGPDDFFWATATNAHGNDAGGVWGPDVPAVSPTAEHAWHLGIGTCEDIYGACCDDESGFCEEDVLSSDCPPPLRFAANTLCEDLIPPCGEPATGACCDPETGDCLVLTAPLCAEAFGGTGEYQGDGTDCDPNPCPQPCIVECPPEGYPEGEPECYADYVDEYNGGCNSTPNVFQDVNPGDIICAESGVFDWEGVPNSYRDTDWFRLYLDEAGDLSWTVEAEFNVLIFMIDAGSGDCNDFVILGSNTAPECVPVNLTFAVTAGEYWLWAGPSSWDPLPCGTPYVGEVTFTPPSGYCDVCYTNCGDGSGGVPDDWITNVTFNTINNTTGPEGCDCSYGDYSAMSTDVGRNEVHNLSVSFFSEGQWVEHVRAWIDWNQNFVFECSESYYLGEGIDATLNQDILIPADAALGPTRMRVIEEYFADPGCDASCDGGTYGETEDYTVNVTTGGPPLGACCIDDICEFTSEEEPCLTAGGDWYAGETCPEFQCPVPPCTAADVLYINGMVLNDYGAPASQCAPDFPFAGGAADDFELAANSDITRVEAWVTFNDAGSIDLVTGIGVTFYANNDPPGPGGEPNDDAACTHTPYFDGGIIQTEIVSMDLVSATDTGVECPAGGVYHLNIDITDVLLSGGTTYWLEIAPVMNYGAGQQCFMMLSDENHGLIAQQIFVAAGIVEWQDIGGNAGSCPDTPDPNTMTDIAFCLHGTALETLGACCDEGESGDCVDGLSEAACTALGYARWEANVACADLEPPCTGAPPCVYIAGDANCNNIPAELPDVIFMIGNYRGNVQHCYECDCPPHGEFFAPHADPNGNCISDELPDVVAMIGIYRGNVLPEDCDACPGQGRIAPGGIIPSLKSKAKAIQHSVD
jgi:hypothetical protein